MSEPIRHYRKRNIVTVERIDDDTYRVNDGMVFYYIDKETYERDYAPIY